MTPRHIDIAIGSLVALAGLIYFRQEAMYGAAWLLVLPGGL
jgi:hypothetical protein